MAQVSSTFFHMVLSCDCWEWAETSMAILFSQICPPMDDDENYMVQLLRAKKHQCIHWFKWALLGYFHSNSWPPKSLLVNQNSRMLASRKIGFHDRSISRTIFTWNMWREEGCIKVKIQEKIKTCWSKRDSGGASGISFSSLFYCAIVGVFFQPLFPLRIPLPSKLEVLPQQSFETWTSPKTH